MVKSENLFKFVKQLDILKPRGIGRRFAIWILVFSSLITLLSTAMQLAIEFKRDVTGIENMLDQVRISYTRSLASSLWVTSQKDVQLQLDGVLRLPGMQYLEIRSDTNTVTATAGKLQDKRTLRQETPLYYEHRGKQVYVGKLIAVASIEDAYKHLEDKLLVILLSNAVKTFLVSLFILLLFQLLVGRHLKKIATHAEMIEADSGKHRLVLDKKIAKNHHHDELDQLVNALNNMNVRLTSAYQQLQQSEEKLSAIINVAPVPFFLNDENQNTTFLNESFTRTLGYSLEDIPTLSDFWSKTCPDPEYREWIQSAWQEKLNITKQNGSEFVPLEVNVSCKDGTVKTMLGSAVTLSGSYSGAQLTVLYDITERKQSDELIWKQANFDTLTGLPNRAMFRDRMHQEITKSSRSHTLVALLLIDLDLFKEVNDALGHDAGDILLKETASRISNCVRASDTVARLGGDEFTVIISELANTADLDKIAQKLINELAAPYQLGDQTIHVSASIGISLCPVDASDIDTLVKKADQAMYAAKNQGRNRYRYFTPAMQEAAQNRLLLSNDLRKALDRGEFLLHYQPQINIKSGRVTGVEALIRWQHPEKGLVAPDLFIPIAEDTGLILPMGEWVMRTALRQLKQWSEQDMLDVKMSVNLSARQFRQTNLSVMVSALLKKFELPASCLELEITESLAMDNPEENTKTLESLRKIGVSVAIDDFGTGHSSLGYLKDFPINCLKLDRSFIMNIETEPDDAIIVSAAINLAHDLGMDVVAEGVETLKQAEYLSRLNCDTIQGYFYSKPVPAAEVEVFIHKSNQLSNQQSVTSIPAMNILIVDDDELICTFLTEVLEKMGLNPSFTLDPHNALEIIQQNPDKFSLIIVDMLMPNMSGIDLVQSIRNLNQETPIVICTSFNTAAIRKTFKPIEKDCNLMYGINYFVLEKPISRDSIIHTIKNAFNVPAHLKT